MWPSSLCAAPAIPPSSRRRRRSRSAADSRPRVFPCRFSMSGRAYSEMYDRPVRTEPEQDQAKRFLAANRSLGELQRKAFWPDVVDRSARGRTGPRGWISSLAGAARELARSGQTQAETSGSTPESAPVVRSRHRHEYADWADVMRNGPADLAAPIPGLEEKTPLHVAFVILPFGFGSGGHEVVFRLMQQLEEAGHACSLWLDDPFGETTSTPVSKIRRQIEQGFGVQLRGPLFKGFDDWHGADVAIATGWQTVWPMLLLPDTRARAYLVNDDEPDFYPTSLESILAEATYGQGLFCIAGTEWMLNNLRDRHQVEGGSFDYTPSPAFEPRPVKRREDTVIVYARTVTHRRAVGLVVMALEELIVNRGRTIRVQMFGDEYPLPAAFDYEFLGLVRPEDLSWAYSEATVGVALSLTNASLAPLDMMACGLPCVDISGGSSESVYGDDAGVEFADFDPAAMADTIQRLLDDPQLRGYRSDAGRSFVAGRSWMQAGSQVEALIRRALETASRR